MWLERYVIVVTSLSRDFLPSSWSDYHGTIWDYATLYGSMGLFLSLMFLFIRFLLSSRWPRCANWSTRRTSGAGDRSVELEGEDQ